MHFFLLRVPRFIFCFWWNRSPLLKISKEQRLVFYYKKWTCFLCAIAFFCVWVEITKSFLCFLRLFIMNQVFLGFLFYLQASPWAIAVLCVCLFSSLSCWIFSLALRQDHCAYWCARYSAVCNTKLIKLKGKNGEQNNYHRYCNCSCSYSYFCSYGFLFFRWKNKISNKSNQIKLKWKISNKKNGFQIL